MLSVGPHRSIKVSGQGESTLPATFRHNPECGFLLAMVKLAAREVREGMRRMPGPECPAIINGWWAWHWIAGNIEESEYALSFRFCCEGLGLNHELHRGMILDQFAEHKNYVEWRRWLFHYLPPKRNADPVLRQQSLFGE